MSKNTVNRGLTTGRPRPRRRQVVENDEFGAFARRIVAAYGRRVASGDVEALSAMVGLADELDIAISVAVAGLRDVGYSWAEIARPLAVSKQAAFKRWAGVVDA